MAGQGDAGTAVRGSGLWPQTLKKCREIVCAWIRTTSVYPAIPAEHIEVHYLTPFAARAGVGRHWQPNTIGRFVDVFSTGSAINYNRWNKRRGSTVPPGTQTREPAGTSNVTAVPSLQLASESAFFRRTTP